jgi:hypothetical protein
VGTSPVHAGGRGGRRGRGAGRGAGRRSPLTLSTNIPELVPSLADPSTAAAAAAAAAAGPAARAPSGRGRGGRGSRGGRWGRGRAGISSSSGSILQQQQQPMDPAAAGAVSGDPDTAAAAGGGGGSSRRCDLRSMPSWLPPRLLPDDDALDAAAVELLGAPVGPITTPHGHHDGLPGDLTLDPVGLPAGGGGAVCLQQGGAVCLQQGGAVSLQQAAGLGAMSLGAGSSAGQQQQQQQRGSSKGSWGPIGSTGVGVGPEGEELGPLAVEGPLGGAEVGDLGLDPLGDMMLLGERVRVGAAVTADEDMGDLL